MNRNEILEIIRSWSNEEQVQVLADFISELSDSEQEVFFGGN